MTTKNLLLGMAICGLLLGGTACSHRHGAVSLNAYTTVRPQIESYNELTMDLDSTPVTYTIDISTAEGKIKLNKLNLQEAQELALVEALMTYKCATLFNPQYTHLTKGNKILRVTVYGYPARYKKK